MGVEYISGLHYRSSVSTTYGEPSSGTQIPSDRGTENDSHTNSITDTKGIGKQGFQVSTVLCPKERWWCETHNQSEGSEYLCGDIPLQDGRHPYAEGYSKTRRLDDISRPEGCLFHATNDNTQQMSTEVSVAGADIPIQLSPLRTVVCTLGLYQDHKASSGHTPVPSTEGDNIHRQYTDYGNHTHCSKRAHSGPEIPIGESIVHCKLPKITPDTHTGYTFPWFHNQLSKDGDKITW